MHIFFGPRTVSNMRQRLSSARKGNAQIMGMVGVLAESLAYIAVMVSNYKESYVL